MGAPPLPIAALALRARNAKSAKERHDLGYFGWEASIRIAVAARPPSDRARLAMPSVGDWVAALEGDDRILDDDALLAAQRLFAEEGLGRASTPKSTTVSRLMEGLPAYRNKIVGHGAVRTAEFYVHAGEILVAGLHALWADSVLSPDDARLVFVESVELDGERRVGRVFDLTAHVATVIDPRGVPIPDTVLPRRLYLERAGTFTCLHPWLVFEAAELRERVLFFNGRGRGPAAYLDFVGGEQLKGKAMAAVCPTVDADLDDAMLARTSDQPLEPEDATRFGDYRLLGKLGEGGMGVVYLARQESLGRLVALKMLPAGTEQDAVAVARFRREITALARCEHPNVVKVLAAGVVNERRYYAMELIEGADLSEVGRVLAAGTDFDQAVSTASNRVRTARREAFVDVPTVERSDAPFPTKPRDRVRALVALFRDAARALEHLHAQGIVHRDVKPANLMVTAEDHRVVLMDLGLAALGDASQSLTRDKSAILGTLRYMPPEQLQRSLLALDRRADVYALGATFYELLTDKPMFDGDTEARLIAQVLREKPVEPREANPSLPRDLALILSKATEKDPKLRYDDAEALARDLDAWLEGRPISARPPSVGYLMRLAIARHRAVAATVAFTVLVALGGVAWFLVRERRLRGEAERAQHAAETARQEAQASHARADVAFARALVEQGRVELEEHEPIRALTYLAAAYPALPTDANLRFLLAHVIAKIPSATLEGHTKDVTMARFSPDGSRVASASDDGTGWIWEAATGRQLVQLRGHTDSVWTVAFSPDGRRVLTASEDDTARVWDADSGEQLLAFTGHAGDVVSAAFSPDGSRVLTASVDNTARVWDASTGDVVVALSGHRGRVWAAAFSPDGNRIVTGGQDATLAIWEVRTGFLVAQLTGHTDDVVAAVFSSDGAMVVSGSSDDSARIWDATTGRLRAHLQGHTDDVLDVSISPDGKRVASASWDQTARVWDVDTGKQLAVLSHAGRVFSAAFSADSHSVVTASDDTSARVWDARTGRTLARLKGHTNGVRYAAFSPDTRSVVTASDDETVRLWSLRSQSVTLDGHSSIVWTASFSPDGGRVVTGGSDHFAMVWDAATGERLARLEGHTKDVWVAAFSPDGRWIITAGDDAQPRIWDASTWREVTRLEGHTAEVNTAHFSSDSRRVVTASSDTSVRLWDATDGQEVARLDGHEDVVWAAEFSPDGRHIASASKDGTARIWDATTGQELTVLKGHGDEVNTAVFSPDGRRVVTASDDESARIWDVETGRLHARLDHARHVRSAMFDHTGERVVTASSDGTARVWDAVTGEEVAKMHVRTGVHFATFTPDGKRVVTASDSSQTAVWDATTGKQLATFEGHAQRVTGAAFSLDGKHLVTASEDATARIWDVHMEEQSPDDVAALAAAQSPWQLVDGVLVRR